MKAQPPIPSADDTAAAPLRAGRVRAAMSRGMSRGAERLRWGLTGLAAIFLTVLVAAAMLRPTGPAPRALPQGEPLAVLGVAPGASPEAGQPMDTAVRPEPQVATGP